MIRLNRLIASLQVFEGYLAKCSCISQSHVIVPWLVRLVVHVVSNLALYQHIKFGVIFFKPWSLFHLFCNVKSTCYPNCRRHHHHHWLLRKRKIYYWSRSWQYAQMQTKYYYKYYMESDGGDMGTRWTQRFKIVVTRALGPTHLACYQIAFPWPSTKVQNTRGKGFQSN